MLRHAIPIALAAAALLAAAPPAAEAGTLACQTVNGQTVCTQGSGSLACQTVNGQTTCLEGPGVLSCQTVNGQTTCSTSRDTAARPAPPRLPWPLTPEGGSSQDVTVEQRNGKLHVRAGGVDVLLD
ncbi:MAG TPA: hypothetical protein VD995_01320 [Azospirillum sp.]|nr:hypothetical protein [Azospirillum sp.]